MSKTPDRRPGTQYEDDAIVFDDRVSDLPSGDVGVYQKAGAMWARDTTGPFNLRQASGGNDNRYLIFKVDGGLVYDTSGDLALKETDA